MHLSDCEHPVRVWNKSLHEYVWTPCGKCNTCRRKRASRWISRLELERSKHICSFFVTLTYCDDFLPRYKADGFGNLFSKDGCILFDELNFDSSIDKGYFDALIENGGIPYASVSDLQKFHKRLNKYFHDKVSQNYKNFRYFVVSERGSTGFRPHFHGIYFIDDERVQACFKEAVLACWSANSGKSYGRCDIQLVQTCACSYVANYVNKLHDLPSFFAHKSLRDFRVCSKRPSIGFGSYDTQSDQEIFESAEPSILVHRAQDVHFVSVSMPSSSQNRLFPKLPFHSKIPNFMRTSLYRISERYGREVETFREWLLRFAFDHYGYKRIINHAFNTIIECLSCLAEGLSSKGVERLRRLYYISKRVLLHCKKFGVSLDYYCAKIDEFYQKKELLLLRNFYAFQSDYSKSHSVEELVFAYPEYCYNNVKSNYVCSIEQTQDYALMRAESAQKEVQSSKSHFKNDYLDRKVRSGDLDYILINVFNFAKLCQRML